MAKFNTGDVVYLKSGSVSMTVKSYNSFLAGMKEQKSDTELTCSWYSEETKEMKHASFHQDMLTTEDPSE